MLNTITSGLVEKPFVIYNYHKWLLKRTICDNAYFTDDCLNITVYDMYHRRFLVRTVSEMFKPLRFPRDVSFRLVRWRYDASLRLGLWYVLIEWWCLLYPPSITSRVKKTRSLRYWKLIDHTLRAMVSTRSMTARTKVRRSTITVTLPHDVVVNIVGHVAVSSPQPMVNLYSLQATCVFIDIPTKICTIVCCATNPCMHTC